MLSSVPASRLKMVDEIGQLASAGAPPNERQFIADFVAQYFRGVADEDLALHDAATLAGIALAHLAHGRTRRNGQPVVRVYNPDPAEEGIRTPRTVALVVCEDMPFLVDSVSMAINQADLSVHLIVHPVIGAVRSKGRLVELAAAGTGKVRMESWQWLEFDRIEDPARLSGLESRIRAALRDVRAAVTDWEAMRRRAVEVAAAFDANRAGLSAGEGAEIRALLEWMADNHFTFLGARYYRLERGNRSDRLVADDESGLGILGVHGRGSSDARRQLTGPVRERARAAHALTVTKANSQATVHRATRLDYVGIKTFDARGQVTGEHRFLGLWTSAMYSANPREIPVLRHKVAAVVGHFGLAPSSHDAKAVLHAIDNYPRDELFQADTESLIPTIRGIVNLYERQVVRAFLRRDAFERYWTVLIYVPRERYGTEVRRRIEAIAQEVLAGDAVESHVELSSSTLARVLLQVRTQSEGGHADASVLEARLRAAVLTWDDSLREALMRRMGDARALSLIAEYGRGLPAAYREESSADDAAEDIARLESMAPSTPSLRIYRKDGAAANRANVRLYGHGSPTPIADLFPVFENLGLRLLSERPYVLSRARGDRLQVQDFELELRNATAFDALADGDRIVETVLAVWRGDADSDGFNRLVVGAGLPWRTVAVLRSYARWLVQTGMPFSQSYIERVLLANAPITRLLADVFVTRFDPTRPAAARQTGVDSLNGELDRQLAALSRLDEDRILRSLRAAIDSTLRTNHFQRADDGQPKRYLALKLASARVPGVPQPHPTFEIWVHAVRVEGVHLRKGAVARGGLRWSDRYEDFRTEVLGLMKAQNVKNTVIVPVGAKGGFVCRQLPAPREEQAREVVSCYQTFIHALLDVTDNIVDGRVVPPPDTVRLDADDTYLVVAADKGTATFSDVANAIAESRGFWLGDAFASGGSAGYDHKKMAITSRGAWECVKRHFRELGVDVQSQPFTAVGIGDMSGDVFGNGMLRSTQMRLVAAFNHQHIFIDPTPDAESSYRERARLFALPRSGWSDYDATLLSAGGGIYPRTLKSIPLSAEAQQLLGLDSASAAPTDVIRAILRLNCDLFWNGGIGTYVKAARESHADVGDRANDTLRVDGHELRCRVVGEGGNLGFTQLGRVEYALRGGRMNTDFIDNSGGVNCSDLEVNIKILLRLASERANLKRAQRDRLLASMTDEVAALVLRNNYLQAQALTAMESRTVERAGDNLYAIGVLERTVDLDRAIEFLPSDSELADRLSKRQALTRPELSILLSYSKIWLYQHLLDSDVPEDPYLSGELPRYFPPQLHRRYRALMNSHPLKREIIATATTNSVINRMGPVFVIRATEDTGATVAAVTRAYAIAREAMAMRDLWSAIEALDNTVPAAVQTEMANATTRALNLATHWVLSHRRSLAVDDNVEALRPSVQALGALLASQSEGHLGQRIDAVRQRLLAAGVPAPLAAGIAQLQFMPGAFDVVEIADHAGRALDVVLRTHWAVGRALGLDELLTAIDSLATQTHWQSVARSSLREDLHRVHRTLTEAILAGSGKSDGSVAVDRWLGARQRAVEHSRGVIGDVRNSGQVDFPTLSVALQSLRRLTGT